MKDNLYVKKPNLLIFNFLCCKKKMGLKPDYLSGNIGQIFWFVEIEPDRFIWTDPDSSLPFLSFSLFRFSPYQNTR